MNLTVPPPNLKEHPLGTYLKFECKSNKWQRGVPLTAQFHFLVRAMIKVIHTTLLLLSSCL